jgi:glycosyltransferase involved in cell wall biosynthesis
MTADTLGGVWTYALELAPALQPYGIDIMLATMGAPLQAAQREAVQQVKNITLFESAFKLEWMDDPWQEVAAAGVWLLELAAHTQPDIVHLNGYVHAALPWQCPILVVGHSCVTSWFAAVKGTEPPAMWHRYCQEVRRGLRCAGLVTAPTRAMLTALHRHYGTFAAAQAIPNGCKADRFVPDVKEPFIFTAGRLWDEAKNIAALDQIAPHLPWPIYVAGEPCHPHGSATRLRNIIGLGQLGLEDVALWLSRAAIFVLPARYEPFGLSALEAGLAACALVLGDIPSLREVWDDAALFVPSEQPEALAEALLGLINNASQRHQFAHYARVRAQQFTPERMAQGYIRLYRQLTGAPI